MAIRLSALLAYPTAPRGTTPSFVGVVPSESLTYYPNVRQGINTTVSGQLQGLHKPYERYLYEGLYQVALGAYFERQKGKKLLSNYKILFRPFNFYPKSPKSI